MTEGNCTGEETEIFYHQETWSKAAEICHGCPVMLECRVAFARDPWAFAGGMDPSRRAAWRRKHRPTPPPTPSPTPTAGPTRAGRRLPQETKDQIIRMFDAELIGPGLIAKRVGVSKSTAQRILRKAGRQRTDEEIQTLTRRGGHMGGRGDGDATRAIVLKLLAEDYKPKEVAEMTGVTFGHIYKIKREAEKCS